MFSCVDLFKCSWDLLTPKIYDIGHVQGGLLRLMYRSFSRDVIRFQNPKLKSHESFYLHEA